ncbi:hypothetical protein ACX0G7_09590 [Flavitalea antarctica]
MAERMTVEKASGFEKHYQTVVMTVIAAFIIGVFTKINAMSELMAKMEERDKSRTEQVSALQVTVTRLNLDLIDMRIRMTKMEEQTKQYYLNVK